MTPPLTGPDTGLNAAVAAEIRAEMARTKTTAAALALAAGVPYGSLRRYLATERHIDISLLAALSEALGVKPEVLVKRAEAAMSEDAPTLADVASEGDLEEAGEQIP